MSASSERLLDVEEAAERLHLAPKTIRAYLRSGALKGIKAGPQGRAGRWRISETELQRFMNEGPALHLAPEY